MLGALVTLPALAATFSAVFPPEILGPNQAEIAGGHLSSTVFVLVDLNHKTLNDNDLRAISRDGHLSVRAMADAGRVPESWSQLGVKAIGPAFAHTPIHQDLASVAGLNSLFRLTLDQGCDPVEVASQLRSLGGAVLDAQVDHVVSQLGDGSGVQDPIPPDEAFGVQYGLHNVGQDVNGSQGAPGSDIRATEAWLVSTGSSDVVVALVDAGVSSTHPDLVNHLVPGWNVLTQSTNTHDQFTSHGTHCAGIIGAEVNGTGVVGVSWDVSIMPVAVLNGAGFGSESLLAEGLIWAADHGARIASVSVGFETTPDSAADFVLRGAVKYATDAGMLIIASAGNCGTCPVAAPARYAETIAVGATNNRDELWPGTSRGPELSIVAPGVDIISTWDSIWQNPNDDYKYATGTSQAAPHVSGVAALILSVDPSLTPAELREVIESTADDLGVPGYDATFAWGRLNAHQALLAVAPQPPRGLSGDDEYVPCPADLNHDGVLNGVDVGRFLNWYSLEDLRADFCGDGRIDGRDVGAFLHAFATGC